MPDAREAIQAIGDSLAAFMKSGPQSDARRRGVCRQRVSTFLIVRRIGAPGAGVLSSADIVVMFAFSRQ